MKKKLAWIGFEGLKVRANHGVYEEERINGNDFVVDLGVEYNVGKAVKSDNIKSALDYERLAEIVAKEMSTPAYLLENVAQRIGARVFKKFKTASRVRIKLAKNNPPLKDGLSADRSYVEIEMRRKDK